MESEMPQRLRLISHKHCPYVQRAVIVAKEKGIEYERVDIDLANKPDWFLAISPTGKVPVLEVTHEDGTQDILFESAVIAEYLDEISEDRLLSADPLARARERAWVEFASASLGDVYQLYVAPDRAQFEKALASVDNKLAQVETELGGTYFAGGHFGLVDAAFAPVFRYFDVFERRAELNVLERRPKLQAWANVLLKRPSVIEAVPGNYSDLLVDFIKAKNSHLAGLIDADLSVAA
jgi:glutathione S-transferase